MKRLCVLLTLCSVLCAGCACAADHYATTDMTWAEFYAGETGETSSALTTQGLDAITTPTVNGISRFPLLWAVSDDEGSTFYGVKDVQVRMTDEVYAVLSNDSRFTFTSTEFDEYKPVNSDGTFGAMITETTTPTDAVVTMATGSSARWGHYVLSVASADITIGSRNRYCDYYLGALLETSDGKVYGLRHDNNIWSNTDIAFCVSDDYVEPHGRGVTRDYDYTVDLEGKTITQITYMLKDSPDVVINNLSLYVKPQTSATVAPASSDIKSGTNKAVPLVFSDVPEDANYSLSSVVLVNGRTRTPVTGYTYADGVLTFDSLAAGTYSATFTSDSYVDIAASFTVTDYYALTDMTYAEFYAGEIGASAVSLDAVTSATIGKAARFGVLNYEIISGDVQGTSANGSITKIYGLADVKVKMTGEVYESLTDKSRYTFSDDVFAEYKAVSSDGSFGKMVTELVEAEGASVTLNSGANATWGNYVLVMSGVGSVDVSGKYLGAVLETSDGKQYGLQHLYNMFFNAGELAFSINELREPHGNHPAYAHTNDLEGKTIKKITYLIKDAADYYVSCDVFVKYQSPASISVDKTSINAGDSVTVTFSDMPDGAAYDVVSVTPSIRHASPIDASLYTYSDGVLTFSADTPNGTYKVVFGTDSYTDLAVTVTVSGYHYATTSMTYEEFYTGEIGASAVSLDAVTSATIGKAARFAVLSYDVVSEDSKSVTKIYGLADVQVRMNDEVYAALSSDSRYTWSNYAFDEYKEVSSDGTFGQMFSEIEELEGATVALSSGASTVWGNYWLKLSGVDSVDVSSKYLGAILETSDGKKYGLQHLYNLFFKNDEMAFCVQDFTEPHGNTPAYAHTNDLAGKTITKITYLLKDSTDYYVTCSVYVPQISTATVSLTNDKVTAGTNIAIPLTFTGLPSGVTYEVISLYSGSGRNRTAIPFTYSGNTLTVSGDIASGNYTAILHTDDGYTDISLSFYVEGPHYATTDMTWAEFYAGEIGTTSADLLTAGLDAVSSPTARVANRFTQLVSESNDIGGRDITGVKDVQVMMPEDVYQLLSNDSRYTFTSTIFDEYKEVDSSGNFGEMFTTYEYVDDAVVTLSSGASATWGNYVLNIASVDVTLGSGDTRYYLGALITTASGDVYGLRHNNNLWFNARDMALSVAEFVEVHGVSRRWEYTASLEGQTITKIQYMLKDAPDVVVNCSVYLKKLTDATVKAVEPSGGWLVPLANPAITMEFSDSVEHGISSVYTGSGRGRTYLTGWMFEDGVLTLSGDAELKTYTAVFSSDEYVDISTSFTFYTVDATSLLVSDDNNGAGLNFLLTPRGAMSEIDSTLDTYKLVNASDYTTIVSNKTESYSAGLSGSGFSFDIVINGVSSDYAAIAGFGKQFTMTRTTLGPNYQRVYNAINAISVGASGFREIASMTNLNSAGLRVSLVQADGTSRDISANTGAGAIISGDSIMLYYGSMAADSTSLTEGEYKLSPEGEHLVNDGVKDGHIKAAVYIQSTPPNAPPAPPASSGGSSSGGTSTTSDDVTSDDRPAPAPRPESGDVPPAPAPGQDSGDVTPQPGPAPTPGQDSGDVTPPAPDDGGNSGGGDSPSPSPTPTVEPTSGQPEAPSVDLQSQSVVETIISVIRALSDTINSLITESTPVAALPESAALSERTLDDVSDSDLAAIPESHDVAVVLPIMRVETPAVYVFGVTLDNLEVGALIFLHMMAEDDSASVSAFSAADAGTEDAYTFLDDDGNETKTVPASKHVNVAAYMEPNKTYAPIISTAAASSSTDSGSTDTNTDTNTGGDTSTGTNTSNPGSSSGGCSSVDSLAAAMMLAVMLLAKRRR